MKVYSLENNRVVANNRLRWLVAWAAMQFDKTTNSLFIVLILYDSIVYKLHVNLGWII